MSALLQPQQTTWILGQMDDLDRRYRALREMLVRACEEDVPPQAIDLARRDVSALLDAMLPPPIAEEDDD